MGDIIRIIANHIQYIEMNSQDDYSSLKRLAKRLSTLRNPMTIEKLLMILQEDFYNLRNNGYEHLNESQNDVKAKPLPDTIKDRKGFKYVKYCYSYPYPFFSARINKQK